MKRLFLIFTVLFLFSAQSNAEETEKISAGDGIINSSFIQPYESNFEFYIQDEEGNLALSGLWTDKVDHFQAGEKTYLRRKVVRYPKAGSLEKDLERVMIVDARSMAPVSTHQGLGKNLEVLYSLHFEGKKATSIFSSASAYEIKRLDLEFDVVPFDRSLWATLAMSVPFEKGFRGDLPFVNVSKGGALDWETISVLGQETIEVGGKSYDAWVILFEQSTWKFWVRKTYPYIVKIDHPFPGDVNKRAISLLKE